MFWLKKVVSFWLMPLPACLALLVAGLLLARRPRGRRLGWGLAAWGTALLLALSCNFVSVLILRPLEMRYPAIPEIAPGAPLPASIASCRFVVVLGSGHKDMPGISATGQLSESGLARIVEGVRIARCLPGARLIVSGTGSPGKASHASVLAKAAISLGIDPSRIILIETANDTEEESLAVARLAAGSRTALVTSAWHMPRAAILFGRAGVDFVPCPADFVSRGDPSFQWTGVRLDSESLKRSTLAVHEWLGLVWTRIRSPF